MSLMFTPSAAPDASDEAIDGLLERLTGGDPRAAESLIPLIYSDLRKLARNYIRKERIGHTLEPTALVHEAYIRMVGMPHVTWENRAHFIAVAATLMRHILVDYARRRGARVEGHLSPGGEEHLARIGKQQPRELVALGDALKLLAQHDPRQARIVELRFFCGLAVEEIARLLSLSDRTVKREWAAAKVWLHDEMNRNKPQ
jgi:RNA polymerase sigma factor (TIGR02999 family)